MTWRLRPGLRLVRRDAGHLQLGVDPPRVAVLPDSRAVRALVGDLAVGCAVRAAGAETARALAEIVRAGLVVGADEEATRRSRRARASVVVDAPGDLLPVALRLVGDAGLATTPNAGAATHALVWGEGEVDRDRLDGWVRSDTPHLVVAERADGVVVGPYVEPGVTACLRCVDAHAGEADPRRALVVAQVAAGPPLRPHLPDPALRALALAWAVRDLVTAAEGERPASWSSTVRVEPLPPVVTAYRRHPHCGCAWADGLAG